jgi:ribulose-bisphosphate carboxylase large chain
VESLTMPELRRRRQHPYIGCPVISTPTEQDAVLARLNRGRGARRGAAVRVTYFFEVLTQGGRLTGLANAAQMVLEHGTLKPWHSEGDPSVCKPADYDEFMSWATDIRLLDHQADEGVESGLVTIAYPLHFFDKRDDGAVPLAQFLMAIASEPLSAFSFYQGARVVALDFPEALRRRFPGCPWPHRRLRAYLGLRDGEPLIGTIVKPKTGLTPELFAKCVVEAALAGARFTKADENMHLRLHDVPRYVGRVVKELEAAGFDLGRGGTPRGTRFLFAPHITTDADRLPDYARAAVEAGANALMFSPYYGGGFARMAEIGACFDVPIYAHTAGMNMVTGSPTWGFDPRIMYELAARYGAACMQITTVGGYLKPDDTEKVEILRALQDGGLTGEDGMTLAIAGGLAPANLGRNLRLLGEAGRLLLAGSSVYGHPDGPASGVKALILAYRAFKERGIEDEAGLRAYATALGDAGRPLARALPVL